MFAYGVQECSDISKLVMQWVRVRVKVTVRLELVLVAPFSEAFVGIAACTGSKHVTHTAANLLTRW